MPKIIETPPAESLTEIPKPQNPKKKHVPLIILVGILALFGIVFFLISSLSVLPIASNNLTSIISKATPTPIPFADLTVPFLRSREYKSSLGELQLVANNGTYTSYLTSYDSDRLIVNGLLTKPTGEMPEGGFPAIIFIHGYIPPTLYQTTGQYADYVDYLARNGFVVFKIDLRGHGNSEGEAGGGYFGSDYIVDTLNARAALQNSDFISPEKIGLWGHSMAGNIVMRSLAAKPEIPAGVIWAGAVYTYEDMQKYGIDDNSYRPPQNQTQSINRRRELFEKHGSPSASSPFWKQVIPTNYLQDLKGAIEIHHAVNDEVVSIGYSRDLMTLLEETSVTHQLHEYPSGGHNITGESFNLAMQRTVEFFQKELNQ